MNLYIINATHRYLQDLQTEKFKSMSICIQIQKQINESSARNRYVAYARVFCESRKHVASNRRSLKSSSVRRADLN